MAFKKAFGWKTSVSNEQKVTFFKSAVRSKVVLWLLGPDHIQHNDTQNINK